MLRLFHISEEENIEKFNPRISKKQWNNKMLYVWAISEQKLHNYLLPRNCPRICINMGQSSILKELLPLEEIQNRKSIIIVPENWKSSIQNCILYKYQFKKQNFKLIDKIAGYYVSTKTESPIHKVKIKNCIKELDELNVELKIVDKIKMLKIKEKIVENLEEFSIIKWSNF
ncbi:hypothetical protein ATO12_14880 [Aquimarina atlantica]|uniref:Uncharacterized protein n=1 Tax=Aquimarina atlantica TaxID=1317122 RepID=A0A023BW50_9FLAO|nr:DUF6886 family protein [Aquimarina atlantica]EZH74154.1 hypothetical protein ATO12_14880 [Aquimarina atlantica]